MDDFRGKVARFAGWVLATLLGCLLGAGVAFGPLALLPGPLQSDLVHGHWLKVGGGLFALAVLTWRLAPVSNDLPFTFPRGVALVRGAVVAMVMAFWPLGLLIWVNGYGAHATHSHDMLVTGIEETHIRSAVTPVRNYTLREAGSSWTADLEVTDERRAFAVVGRCVRIDVAAGRLGLDWISNARPIACPRNAAAVSGGHDRRSTPVREDRGKSADRDR